jgi:hypothetical protein
MSKRVDDPRQLNADSGGLSSTEVTTAEPTGLPQDRQADHRPCQAATPGKAPQRAGQRPEVALDRPTQHVYTDDTIETKRLRVELSHLVHCPAKLPLTDCGNDPLRTPQILWFNREKHALVLQSSNTRRSIGTGVNSLTSSTWSTEHLEVSTFEKTGAFSTWTPKACAERLNDVRCRGSGFDPTTS